MASLAAGPDAEGNTPGALAPLGASPRGERVSADLGASGVEPAGDCGFPPGEEDGGTPSCAGLWPTAGTLRKRGGTSMVNEAGARGSGCAGQTGSMCDAWRTPPSARDSPPLALRGLPAAVSPSTGSPGNTLRQGCETIIWPLTGSKRAIRQTFFRGPPTSSHGSQKL